MIIKQLKVGVMEVFCYILGCEDTSKGLLIDPAGDEDVIMDTARDLGLNIESVVNTHGHP
ncbi:MAG: MBL fold metallo-hydrolase, partial [Deltaproteobacteria bacterium]|nr:MBL fold metallo-hydrolase [Deltaproteobacteria bacterium]